MFFARTARERTDAARMKHFTPKSAVYTFISYFLVFDQIFAVLIQQALSTRVWDFQPCEYWTFKIEKLQKMTEMVSNNILAQESSTTMQVVRLADFLMIISLIGEEESEDKCDIWAF